MTLVVLDTPQGSVAINPAQVFCVIPGAQTPVQDCEVQFDSLRQVLVLLTADVAAGRLGGLRRLAPAGASGDVWINPALVMSVAPHPQVTGVCFVNGAARKVAVKGDLAAIVAALA